MPEEKRPGRPPKAPHEMVEIGETYPNPKGQGRLKRGNPGNKGGGPTPTAIRKEARQKFWQMLPELASIAADGEGATTKDRLRAMDLLGKYGLGQARGIDEEEFELIVVELASAVQVRLRQVMSVEEADSLLGSLFEDWKGILREHRAVSEA